jgi:hypothetical protein
MGICCADMFAGRFGDERVAGKKGRLLLERMAKARTPIVRVLGQGRAGTVALGIPTTVHWRLLTTRAVKSAVDGWAVVEDYRQRWRIEDYFPLT